MIGLGTEEFSSSLQDIYHKGGHYKFFKKGENELLGQEQKVTSGQEDVSDFGGSRTQVSLGICSDATILIFRTLLLIQSMC